MLFSNSIKWLVGLCICVCVCVWYVPTRILSIMQSQKPGMVKELISLFSVDQEVLTEHPGSDRERHTIKRGRGMGSPSSVWDLGFAHPSLGFRKERAMVRLRRVSVSLPQIDTFKGILLSTCLFTQGASPSPGRNLQLYYCLPMKCVCAFAEENCHRLLNPLTWEGVIRQPVIATHGSDK